MSLDYVESVPRPIEYPKSVTISAFKVDEAGGVATMVPTAQYVSALSMLLDVFL